MKKSMLVTFLSLVSILCIILPISSYATVSPVGLEGKLVKDDMGTLSPDDDRIWYNDLSAFKMTYSDQLTAINNLGTIDGFSGFRMATLAEVVELLREANWPSFMQHVTATTISTTPGTVPMTWWWGRSSDRGKELLIPPDVWMEGQIAPELGYFPLSGNTFVDSDWVVSDSSTIYSAWIVSSVPEPTVVLLLSFGLVGIAGVRRLLKK
jgi:hypothetical protein